MWLGSPKNNISKLGSFRLLGWLATFSCDGIQAQRLIKLLGWLTNPTLILVLGKHSQEFIENLGRLVINYFLPKLLVTYGRFIDNIIGVVYPYPCIKGRFILETSDHDHRFLTVIGENFGHNRLRS